MKTVICNKSSSCKNADGCGGAEPHYECDECNNCQVDQSATCEPFIKAQEADISFLGYKISEWESKESLQNGRN